MTIGGVGHMPSVATLTVQATNDPDVKAYHTRFELSSGPEVGSRGCDESVGEFGRLVLAIPGVAQVHVCPYILLITKAPLFEWAEIEPVVLQILKEFARSQADLAVFAEKTILELTQEDASKSSDRVPGHRPFVAGAARQNKLGL
jgi:hypothetical protein